MRMGQTGLANPRVSQADSWSTKALVIGCAFASRVVYRDVETNGWANFNCRKGAVRFWFKPNWSNGGLASGSAPFVGIGSGSDSWVLAGISSGNQIGFSSAGNQFFAVPCTFTAGRWMHIAFNYSPTSLALYTNGVLAANWTGSAWNYPGPATRAAGLAFGNMPGGSFPLEGQLEEMETFNYCLPEPEIVRSFNSVKSVDSDLNGTADLLEEITLTSSAPFMGVPFPVTGVFEAEQFDHGGPEKGYHTLDAANATTGYRVSQLCITNADDLGGGYCVDRLQAGDWLRYTMDVRVGQTYAVEARVAGIGSNGVFTIGFSSGGVTNGWTTNHLTIPGAGWTNVTFKNLYLPTGTNVMTVTMLTNGQVNGASSGYVGKLNYVSIYPSWNEGVASFAATNNLTTNELHADAYDWATAQANSVAIQNAIDSMPNGGLVTLPAGKFYVASREIPNEMEWEFRNTAVFVAKNNVMIQGVGKTNTTLVAHNRAVTAIYIGRTADPPFPQTGVTNFALADLTLEGSPHWVYTNAPPSNRAWEEGAFEQSPPRYDCTNHNTGCLMVGQGLRDESHDLWLENIVITNCLFKNSPVEAIALPGFVNRFLAISNEFLFRADGTNGSYTGQITDPSRPTTVATRACGAGIFGRAAGAGYNVNVIGCTYNGHVNSTNVDSSEAAVGLIFYQWLGGNWFTARNAMTNYVLEGIQWNSGPAAAVQNRFQTGRETGSTCALNCWVTAGSRGPTSQQADLGFSFVGNRVIGGRQGVFTGMWGWSILTSIPTLLVSGNEFASEPPSPVADNDSYGAVLNLWWGDRVVLSGNTLTTGGKGLYVGKVCTNGVVLANDFSAAKQLGLEDCGIGSVSTTVARNKLGSGVEFHHLRGLMGNGDSYFFGQNTYLNTNGTPVNLQLEPLALPAHIQP